MLLSEDTEICLEALKQLNLIQMKDGKFQSKGISHIKGCAIYVGNSGTTARFLLPLILFCKEWVEFSCHPQLEKRPIKDLMDCLVA